MQTSVVKKFALFLAGVTLLCVILFSCIITSQNALRDAPDTQMHLTIRAASRYIRDNHATLADQVKNNRTVTISAKTLVKQGYLPPDFLTDTATHQQFQLNVMRNPQSFSQFTATLLVTGNNITRSIDPLGWPFPQTTAGVHYTKAPA